MGGADEVEAGEELRLRRNIVSDFDRIIPRTVCPARPVSCTGEADMIPFADVSVGDKWRPQTRVIELVQIPK